MLSPACRAAYAGEAWKRHNRSIGSGSESNADDLSRDQSAKRNIRAWMADVRPEKTRDLLERNPRYTLLLLNKAPSARARATGGNGKCRYRTSGSSPFDSPLSILMGRLVLAKNTICRRPRMIISAKRTGLRFVAQMTVARNYSRTARPNLFVRGGPLDAGALAGP